MKKRGYNGRRYRRAGKEQMDFPALKLKKGNNLA
jgi:hypothetical protein